jgi:hypothetical protein
MQSPFSFLKVMGFLLINVLVSAVTTWVVVRTLIPPLTTAEQLPSATAIAATSAPDAIPASSETSTPAPDAGGANAIPAPATPLAAQPTPTLKSAEIAATQEGVKDTVKDAVNVKIASVIYAGQLSREVVVLLNEGEQVDMRGWKLVPPRGEPYTFGQVTMFKSGFVNLHTTTGADVPNDLYWGLGEPMWQSGDEVKLLRKDGGMAATFTVK